MKKLTICLPTFNRAKELELQLEWLASDIQGYGDQCEVIVSDNCSTDDTPKVVEKWKSFFEPITSFQANRNTENIGWMKNFFYCIHNATGQYIWIIGDDDPIAQGTLEFVLKKLVHQPEISLMYLNFSGRHKDTDEILGEYWFDRDLESSSKSGKAVFQQCLAKNIGSVIFITSTIFKAELLQEALKRWPDSIKNWAGLAYWSGYCALKGEVLVTKDNYVQCTMGASYWQKDPKAWFGISHRDIPEVYVKLQGIGYPRKFCRKQVFSLLKEDFAFAKVKYYLWCFIKAPIWSIKVITSCLYAVFVVIFGE